MIEMELTEEQKGLACYMIAASSKETLAKAEYRLAHLKFWESVNDSDAMKNDEHARTGVGVLNHTDLSVRFYAHDESGSDKFK